jgi:hypothetical protein
VHLCALWIFSSSFWSIGSLLPIDRHSILLRSADYKQDGCKVDLFLFFWTDVHAIRSVDSSTTLSWPF